MSVPRVAVIGGGMAGLAAACRLRRFAVEVVAFEAETTPGGVVLSVARDGWLAELGPHLVAAADPALRDLLDSAGFAACAVRPTAAVKRNYIVHGAAALPLPVTVAELSSTPLLSMSGRLRFAKDLLMGAGSPGDEESVDAFARRRFGDEVAERLFDPRVTSTSGGDPAAILARYAFPAEVGYERSHGSVLRGSIAARMAARRRARGKAGGSWSCRQGMQELPARLAAQLGAAMRTNSPVRAVAGAGNGFAVHTGQHGAEQFDAVVFAVPAPALGRIAVNVASAEELAPLSSMPHASMAVVSLGFRRADVAHPLDGYRLLIPSREQREILSVVFASSILPDRAPPGHVLLTTYLGGARRPDLPRRSEPELVELVLRELGQLLGVRGTPVFTQIARHLDALPLAVGGHAGRLAGADAVELANPSLAFAGNWRDGVALSDVLLGGIRAAERLAERSGWTARHLPE